MMGPKPARARIVAAVFTVAMFYASVCSSMCAAGFCPNEFGHSAGTGNFGQILGGVHKHVPENDDCCSMHHPTVNVVRADNLPQPRFANTGHVNASDLLANSTRVMSFSLAAFSLSDLAPPPTQERPLYQRISLLRI